MFTVRHAITGSSFGNKTYHTQALAEAAAIAQSLRCTKITINICEHAGTNEHDRKVIAFAFAGTITAEV